MLTTMCGHGMISSQPGEEDDRLGQGRPAYAGAGGSYMARFCSCGVFNPSRAKRILEEARIGHQAQYDCHQKHDPADQV